MTKFTLWADIHDIRKSASWNPISRFLMCCTLSLTLLADCSDAQHFFLFWFQWEPITAQTFNHVTKVDGAHWMMYRKLSSWTGLTETFQQAVQTLILKENSEKRVLKEDLQQLSRNEKMTHKIKARCVRADRKAFAKAWAKRMSRGFFQKLFQSYYQWRVGFVLNDEQNKNNYKIMRLPIWFSCSCQTLQAKR